MYASHLSHMADGCGCVFLADMRGDVQTIFKETPHDKQVMMFSATLAKEIRSVCKKFMNKVRPSKEQSWSLGCAATFSCSLAAILATQHTDQLQDSRHSSIVIS